MGTKMNFNSPLKAAHQDIYGVAAKFVELLQKHPSRFNPETRWWENIHRPDILNKVLENATGRLKAGADSTQPAVTQPSENDWANWMGIAKWIVAKGWSLDTTVRFLGDSLKSTYSLPDAYSQELPELLRNLIEAEDTRLAENSNPFGDWITTAINSIRGQMIEALLNFALRQKNAGREIDPWIFELIRARVQHPKESPAIFALLGSKLRFLTHLFGGKLKGAPDLLFPTGRNEHRSAAVIAYFIYDHPWNVIIQTFPQLLDTAISILGELQKEVDNDTKNARREFGSRLGIHIACYYWSESIPVKDAEAAMDKFFSCASKKTCAHVIGQIATLFDKPPDEGLDGKIIARVMHLWERRFETIKKNLQKDEALISEYAAELSESTDWLGCECFPFEWRFTHSKQAIERLKKAPNSYRLLKTICEFGAMPVRLDAMLQLLCALLKKPSDELRWSIQFKDIAPLISQGLASSSSKRLAEECRDLLLKMGFSNFLNLEASETK